MRILDPDGSAEPQAPLIACFGLGLIGSAAVTALRLRGRWREEVWPFTWGDGGTNDEALRGRLCGSGRRVHILWAAGRAGFGAAAAEIEPELRDFERVVSLAEGLVADGVPGTRLAMISSAGGLFEGRRLVDSATPPQPRRPYGWLKLRQEARLLAADPRVEKLIFRPSTVYGPVQRTARQGLIAVLIRNCLRRAVSYIAGTLATQRDYVHAFDLGRYLALTLHDPTPVATLRTEILAAGRPTTIADVVQVIERCLARKLYLRFDPEPLNALDITFAQSALPPFPWRVRDLDAGVRQIFRLYLTDEGLCPAFTHQSAKPV